MRRAASGFGGGRSPRRYQNGSAHGQWAEIVRDDPAKYPSPLMQSLALATLHRQDQQHESQGCPLCVPLAKEITG